MENDGSESSGGAPAGVGRKGFMLFGVRLMEGSSSSSFIRKSASANNLSQFEQAQEYSNNDSVAAGYATDDVVLTSDRSRHRKRGVAWSEEEHKLFLLGLQKVGKGDWRGISRNFVKTRTPTQVASHAQKYFLRRNNHSRRRRRSSLFDITTEAVLTSAKEEEIHPENQPPPPIIHQQTLIINNLEKLSIPSFPAAIVKQVIAPLQINPMDQNFKILQVNQLTNSPRPLSSIPILPPTPSPKEVNSGSNKSGGGTIVDRHHLLSLQLSSTTITTAPSSAPPQGGSPGQQPPPAGRHAAAAAFQAMPASFNGSGGESIISVA